MHKTMLLRSFQLVMSIFLTNLNMYVGDIALRILGQQMILYRPMPLINMSHIMTIGAKMKLILLVPYRCNMKRETKMAHAAGTGKSEMTFQDIGCSVIKGHTSLSIKQNRQYSTFNTWNFLFNMEA